MNVTELLTDYISIIVLGICLIVGYIIKQWIPDVNNKVILTVVAILGCIINVWLNEWTLNPAIILGGLISGLASTGFHQMLKQLISHDACDH